ncbi:MAG: ABC transporter permease subunit [Promicromonosporaceae bacterium]|nr:ABC transporter permease subunit [Promicromonosporaceae bacterium]
MTVEPKECSSERQRGWMRSRADRTTTVGAVLTRIGVLSVVSALGLYLVPLLISYRMWLWLTIVLVAIAAIFAIYSTRRFVPAKYIFPGTFFLAVLLIVPVLMTVNYSFTNFGDGHRGTKEQAVSSIIGNSVHLVPGSPTYRLTVATQGSAEYGPFALFLVDDAAPEGDVYRGVEGQPLEVFPGEVMVVDGRVTAIPGYRVLTPHEVNAAFATIREIVVMVDEESAIRIQGTGAAFQGRATLAFEENTGVITDLDTGETFTVGRVGNSYVFVDADGQRAFPQSWLQYIGLDNYIRLFTNRTIAGEFLQALIWTLMFAFSSVFLTFIIGFFLAVTLNDRRVRGRKAMRSWLLLPYAVPGFISILIWSNFFNRDFGLINDLLGTHLNWLGDPTLARFAVILTNTWLGFPYMFIVCTGALQSIPDDVLEAARIDGASGWQSTWKITMPLLLVSVAPLLVASFAFNFNNFNVIELLTQGGPFAPGQFTRGSTDILISMVYRIAFGGDGADFGFASAVSVALFVLTGVLAAIQFRFTKRLEDIA